MSCYEIFLLFVVKKNAVYKQIKHNNKKIQQEPTIKKLGHQNKNECIPTNLFIFHPILLQNIIIIAKPFILNEQKKYFLALISQSELIGNLRHMASLLLRQ